MTLRYIVGVDEVGRGPLAGPVTVCAFSIPIYAQLFPWDHKDSKKLNAKKREEIAKWVKKQKHKSGFRFSITPIPASRIDSHGISACIRRAIAHSLKKLKLSPRECLVLLDGGLQAPPVFIFQQTIIKGDEHELSIALASIMAKVHRDTYMTKLSRKYPQYSFKEHKGYGTKKHREEIRLYGTTPVHRTTYLKNM